MTHWPYPVNPTNQQSWGYPESPTELMAGKKTFEFTVAQMRAQASAWTR